MKISYFLRDNGACGILRLDNPLQALKEYKMAEVMFYEKGDPEDKLSLCLEADIIVVPRPHEEQWHHGFKQLQNGGKKIVIDFDDDMFNISPFNPAYQEYGSKPYTHILPDGKEQPIWVEGFNFNTKANQRRLDGFKISCELADMITVTSPVLADVYKKYNNRVAVLPNCLDMREWRKLDIVKPRNRKLFWTGGGSHFWDWYLMRNVLPEIMWTYTDVELVILGAVFPESLKGLPQDRVKTFKWCHTRAYPYVVASINPDVAMIPLQENHFNKCKSEIKYVEMSCLQIPSVVSHVTPYKEHAQGDNAFWVENDTGAWIEAIRMALDNNILRAKVAGEAYRTVRDRFDINKQYTHWHDTYKNLIGSGR